MPNEPIVITREALYERVWSEPISEIAAEFGQSGRGLAKLCARYDIPVPPRGWWAKKAAGHDVPRPPLPASRQPKPITVERHAAPTPAESSDDPPEIAFELQPENRIVVPERLTRSEER